MKLNWFHYLCLIFDDVYIQFYLYALPYVVFKVQYFFTEFPQRLGLSGPFLLPKNFPFLNQLGLSGLEPPTSRLSGVRSNQLSYKPMILAPTCFPIPSPV